jgi:hypothetical protein
VKLFLMISFSIICTLPVAFGASNRVFLFASPATEDSLTDMDAKARLASFKQNNATAVADRSACSLTRSVEITNALGIYETSSENSFIMDANLEKNQSEYLAALFGLYSRQEFILLFFERATGADRLWIIKTQDSPEEVIAALRKWRLTPVTVRPNKNQTEVWFVDFADKRESDLKNFTSEMQGHASSDAGLAELLGKPNRDEAVNAWRQQISAYERQSGTHLSRKLSSRSWRAMTAVHTCSRELPPS